MIVLGIETSCDETSAAIVGDGRKVYSNIISSQTELHKKFGGVVPELAGRRHVEDISGVVDEALLAAGMGLEDIDTVAVTYGPGLVGALLVGLSYAKALSFCLKKPLIGVHHIEGHICANYLENEFSPPFMCLVVSGGHTHLVSVEDYGKYKIIGKTLDDAAGEAYDKVARALGLSYPGGPAIDRLAVDGNVDAIQFPRAYMSRKTISYDFSFSGLKSAVLNYVNKCRMTGESIIVGDVAAAFQQSVVEVLVNKAAMACEEYGIKKIALAGGVSSNTGLRQAMSQMCREQGFVLNMPLPVYCTDNAAMIASCAYYEAVNGKSFELDLNAYPDLELGGF